MTERRDVSYWRDRTVLALLRTTSLVGLFAYVPSAWLAIREGYWGVAIIDTVVYAWVVAVTVWPRATYGHRVASLTGLSYILGVVLLTQLGVAGGGLLWLSTGPVFISVMVGLRAALLALAANVAILAVIGWAITAGLVDYIPFTRPADGFWIFVVNATSAMLISAAVAVSVGVLLRGLAASHQDLTHEIEERARAEAEQRRLEGQLRQAHKLEAVGRLASGVAHDFNNLLVPVLANAQELRRRLPPAHPDAAPLDDIVLSAERGRTLVRRVLTLGRRTLATRRTLAVGDGLRESAQLLRAGTPADVEIVVDIDVPTATVLADPLELHQVVMNLGTNAAHAMRTHGGRLTLSQRLEVEGFVTLRVIDTGEGMPEYVRVRAVEPFYTTKSIGEGSGLGLSTVLAIVHDLGGRLEIESRPGRGTTVRVDLPLCPAATEDVSAANPRDVEPTAPGVSAGPSPGRVLVVDDEPLVLKTCTMVLTRLGYDVRSTTQPEDAAEILRAEGECVDLLITDKAMPGLDGVALATLARRLHPALPIIVATGYLDEATSTRLEEIGGTQVIAKPYRIDVLARIAADAIGNPAERA